MSRQAAIVMVSLLLAACQGMSSLPGSEAARPALPGDRPAAEPPNPVCGYLEFFPPLHPSGGSQRVPHIVGSRELSGSFQYAAFHWRARVKSLTESCPPDTDYLPVPNGYRRLVRRLVVGLSQRLRRPYLRTRAAVRCDRVEYLDRGHELLPLRLHRRDEAVSRIVCDWTGHDG